MSVETAVNIAQEELRTPTWEMTRQLLGCHSLVTGPDGNAVVAGVDAHSDPGSQLIYFSVRDQEYHLLVTVCPDDTGKLALAWVSIEPRVSVFLRLRSEATPPDQITAAIGLTPSFSVRRGESSGRAWPAPSKQHCWGFELDADKPGQLEHKLTALLAALESYSARIAGMAHQCSIEIGIIVSAWRGDSPAFYNEFPSDVLRQVAQMGASLWIRLYASGPPLPDDITDDDTSTS